MSERYLPSALRNALAGAIKEARIAAEEGARDAIRRLGVADSKAPEYLKVAEKELRRRLRAHARALGDSFDRTNGTQETKHLNEAAGYAHWHRMLFARFLAERGLLRNPEYDVPVTLEDCRELAEAEGLTDPWAIAERYSAEMLPAVFRIDDPVLALETDPVHTQKLQKLVRGLDTEVFQAEDSLGWTYQFWRAAEKDAINASGVKIGANQLPAVTQLFTEPYMVRFLLHNTLGAWWAGKVLAANMTLVQTAKDENELRSACSLPNYSFDMLRFVRDGENGLWRPAAGSFPGWPKEAKAVTMLDPCCGSGHFLTEALAILVALRTAEEDLPSADAVIAVLRDNLHGLEIDGRCVQIAAFAVALTAWRLGGWQILPTPQIAWVGAPPPLPKKEFAALADGDPDLEYALEALHDFFSRAPILGTLLEPTGGDLFEVEKLQQVEALLAPILEKVRKAEPERVEGMISARGMADAAELLHRKYVYQATNVPFLGRNKQVAELVQFLDERYPNSSADLAPTMVLRMLRLTAPGGSISFVTPQNWLFLKTYRKMRQNLLTTSTFEFLSPLGSRAFETISGEVVNVALVAMSQRSPDPDQFFSGIDASNEATSSKKAAVLINGPALMVQQSVQLGNAESRILLQEVKEGVSLSHIADVYEGLSRGDSERFDRKFWEIGLPDGRWRGLCESSKEEGLFSGRSTFFLWENGKGALSRSPGARIQGLGAWDKDCVIVERTGSFKARLSVGDVHAQNCVALVPKTKEHLATILSFAQSDDFRAQLKKLADKLILPTGVFLQTKLNPGSWSQTASIQFSSGLPEPASLSPKNWLFLGHPADCDAWAAIHIALARLCGFRWPAEIDPSLRLSHESQTWVEKSKALPSGDNDGLLGVPAVAGEKPLANRLRATLASIFEPNWSEALERELVAAADEQLDKKSARDGSLEAWVRDRAFRQHCSLFDQRPFLWHISDGLKDGFSVFVHYHRFDQANLRKLTYTLLGDWLARAKAEGNSLRYEKGRELQQALEKILEGEKPYDIFVRWKSPAQQSLGWDPDLDDGVRQNIRPFIKAGVLTHKLNKILKDKDRGKDVTSAPWFDVFNGERRNDHHTTLSEKRAARGVDT